MKRKLAVSDFDARIVASAFVLNTVPVPLHEPVTAFELLLGHWSRQYDGPQKAPYGHRNPVRYIYDELGIELLDDWTDGRIIQVTFHYQREPDMPFSPEQAFVGSLSVLGTALDRVKAWDALSKRLAPPFRPSLRHILVASVGIYRLCAYFTMKNRQYPLLASFSVSSEQKACVCKSEPHAQT